MPDWKEQLSKAWGGQDLSKDAYDYDKYYRDQPVAAWIQLRNIEANKWSPYITSAHFPDGGRSGLYKTSQHPTYPGLGDKSWSPDGSVYYLSDQQYMNPKDYHSTDDTLDYLGSDYSYHKGGTHVVYKGANVLPTLWVLPKDRGFNLRINKYDNGFEYKDRKQDIKIPYKQWGGGLWNTITNKAQQLSKQASDAYSKFSDSPWNTVYDIANTGLYVVAPFTGGVTLVPAMAMSIGQGIAAANNMAHEGVSLNNGLDVAGAVLAAPAKSVMTQIMKAVGKNTKRVKQAKLFRTYNVGRSEAGKTQPSLFSLARSDKKYVPMFAYTLAVPTVGNAQIANDLKDNYESYVAPWVGYQDRLAQRVKQETNARRK